MGRKKRERDLESRGWAGDSLRERKGLAIRRSLERESTGRGGKNLYRWSRYRNAKSPLRGKKERWDGECLRKEKGVVRGGV